MRYLVLRLGRLTVFTRYLCIVLPQDAIHLWVKDIHWLGPSFIHTMWFNRVGIIFYILLGLDVYHTVIPTYYHANWWVNHGGMVLSVHCIRPVSCLRLYCTNAWLCPTGIGNHCLFVIYPLLLLASGCLGRLGDLVLVYCTCLSLDLC